MEVKDIYEMKTLKMEIAAGNNNQVSLPLRGNNIYGKVLGFSCYAKNKATGAEVFDCEVAVQESGGRVLLTPAPYRLVRSSEQVAFKDRFVELHDVKGYEQDLNFNIKSNESVDVEVYITACYTKRG